MKAFNFRMKWYQRRTPVCLSGPVAQRGLLNIQGMILLPLKSVTEVPLAPVGAGSGLQQGEVQLLQRTTRSEYGKCHSSIATVMNGAFYVFNLYF